MDIISVFVVDFLLVVAFTRIAHAFQRRSRQTVVLNSRAEEILRPSFAMDIISISVVDFLLVACVRVFACALPDVSSRGPGVR